jgi:hypothetical protein
MEALTVRKLDFGQKNVYRVIRVQKLPPRDYQVHITPDGKAQEFRSDNARGISC